MRCLTANTCVTCRAWCPGSSSVVIIMEYLKFGSRSDQSELGRRLAQMHLATPAVRLIWSCCVLIDLACSSEH